MTTYEFVNMHAMAKNLQSIRDETRFQDFVTDIASIPYDIGFLTETWRKDREEIICMPKGGTPYLSGGMLHRGVGISFSKKFEKHLDRESFQSIFPRFCTVDFSFKCQDFRAFAVCFPTAWDADEAVDELYDLVELLLWW